MSRHILKLSIFLSSPGDVATERKIAREILDSLKDDPFIKDKATIEVIAWEAPASRVLMPVSLTPQQAIDQNLAKPSETDATIVLLWGRMGSPLDTGKHGVKPNGEQYWSGTEWEYLDAVNGSQTHPKKLPIVLVYRRTDDTTPPQQKDFQNTKDYLEALKQYAVQLERVETFFEDFRGEGGEYRQNFYQYSTPDDFRAQFTKDARLLVQELLQKHNSTSDASSVDSEPEQDIVQIQWDGSPFPGLRAFTQKDEPIFFGRGYETADLIKRLSKQRLMFVVGASGSGKSSLVGAGVIPQLERGAIYGVAGWYIARFTPGDRPFMRLSEALLRAIPALKDPLADDEERAIQLSETLQKTPDKLSKMVEKWLLDDPEGTEILLFVDQFEELFTSVPQKQRKPFADMLGFISPQIRVIATMRSDFYDRALRYFETVLRDASYTLSTPSDYALREMIERPAQVTGLSFTDGLPELIVKEMSGQIGGLALVAYLLEEMYLVAKKRGDKQLTQADYDALGGVEKAIATRASSIYKALDMPDERKKAVLQRVFSELVEPTVRDGDIVATRRRADVTNLRADDDAKMFIEAFQTARLLVTDDGMVEVAHEALLREWDDLSKWIATVADDLRLLRQVEREAIDWDAGGRTYRMTAARLMPIYSAIERFNYHLSDVMQDFVYPHKILLTILDNPQTSEQDRMQIGIELAELGDPRDGVGVIDGVPDIVWLPVDIPENLRGRGLLGKKKIAFKDEDGNQYGKFEMEPFFISKYLTTYIQYQAFVSAEDGYQNKRWWEGFPDADQHQEPSEQRTKSDNNPCDSISWYQSVAFSRWLNEQLKGLELSFAEGVSLIVGETAEIRLPTEWEWQWVAQNGQEERDYPWGNWQRGFADTSESGLGRAIAVGMYPHGQAVCGALDMSGNLREWCLNDYGNPEVTDGFGNEERKVLRGGAFSLDRNRARASYRKSNFPLSGSLNFGCRVVVAPILRP